MASEDGAELRKATKDDLIGYVVDTDPQMTACVGCVLKEKLGPRIGEIRDNESYGEQVPYPECGVCGGVIRPQETETCYECTRCGDRFETLIQVRSHVNSHNGEVDAPTYEVVNGGALS